MAEESKDDKTEEATPKRRQDSREKGTVAKSTEVNSVIVLLAAIMMLKFFGLWMFNQMGGCMVELFSSIGDFDLTPQRVVATAHANILLTFKILMPVCLAILFAGLLANIIQIGFLFTLKPLTPDLKKINPITGFGRLFSMKSLVEAVKNIMKIALIGIVAYLTVADKFPMIMQLLDSSVQTMLAFSADTAFTIILRVALLLIIIAICDFAYQKHTTEKGMRMTKQEVKDEHKQMDGDPKVKARIKSVQREMARRRMMSNVPKATVVVTNPTHLAIALRYEPSEGDAPVVVAKGKDLVAARIRQIAREHDVPIIEDKPLARAMYGKIEIGFPIPTEFFNAVAEILAYVYKLKHRAAA